MNTIGGTDPLSRQFQAKAANNMASQMGTVKSEKDLKSKDQGLDPQDKADIKAMIDASTVTAEEGATAAANSGELAELADDFTEDDEEKIERRQHGEEQAAAEAARSGKADGTRVASADSKSDDLRAEEIRADQEKLTGIRAGIPDEVYTAAEQVVKGQLIDENTPARGLAELKAVESVGLEPTEGSLPLADIHDTHNSPIPEIAPDDSVPAELKARAAELEASQAAAAARGTEDPAAAAVAPAGPADPREAYQKMVGLAEGTMGDFNALTTRLFHTGRPPEDLLTDPPFRRKSAAEAGSDLAFAVDYLTGDHAGDPAVPDPIRSAVAGQGEDMKRYLDQANSAMARDLTEKGVPKDQWNLHFPAFLSREIMADQPEGQPRSKCLYMTAYHYLNSEEVAEALNKGEAPPAVVATPPPAGARPFFPGAGPTATPSFGGPALAFPGGPAAPLGFPRPIGPPAAAPANFAASQTASPAWMPPAGNRFTPGFLAAAGVRMPGSAPEEPEVAEASSTSEATPVESAPSLPDPGITGPAPYEAASEQGAQSLNDFHRLASLAATTRKPVEDLVTSHLPFDRKPFEQASQELGFAVDYVMTDHSRDAAVPDDIKPALASQRQEVAAYIDGATTRMGAELDEKGVPREDWHRHFPAYLCREIMADQPDGVPRSKSLYMTAFHYLNCQEAHEAVKSS